MLAAARSRLLAVKLRCAGGSDRGSELSRGYSSFTIGFRVRLDRFTSRLFGSRRECRQRKTTASAPSDRFCFSDVLFAAFICRGNTVGKLPRGNPLGATRPSSGKLEGMAASWLLSASKGRRSRKRNFFAPIEKSQQPRLRRAPELLHELAR